MNPLLQRNRYVRLKCQRVCITLLALRKFRGRLCDLDVELIVLVARMIWRNFVPNEWIDEPESVSDHGRLAAPAGVNTSNRKSNKCSLM